MLCDLMSVSPVVNVHDSFVTAMFPQPEKSSLNVCLVGETPTLYAFVVEVPTKMYSEWPGIVQPSASLQPFTSW